MLDTKMPAALLVPLQGVQAHQFGKLQKVRDSARMLERLIKLSTISEDIYVFPELCAHRRDFLKRLLQSLGVSSHSALIPHQESELPVERRHGLLSFDRKESIDSAGDVFLRRSTFRPVH